MSVMCAMMASFSVDFFFPSLEEDRRRRSGFEMAPRDVDNVVVVGALQWTIENPLVAEKDSASDAMEARRARRSASDT